MESDTLHTDRLVEERMLYCLAQPLQLLGVAAVFGIDEGFVDGEIEECPSLYNALLGSFAVWNSEWQGGYSVQTSVVNDFVACSLWLWGLFAQDIGDTYLHVGTHVQRRACLHTIKAVGKNGVAQFHAQFPFVVEPIGDVEACPCCRHHLALC